MDPPEEGATRSLQHRWGASVKRGRAPLYVALAACVLAVANFVHSHGMDFFREYVGTGTVTQSDKRHRSENDAKQVDLARRQAIVCNKTSDLFGDEWAGLCEGDFIKSIDSVLIRNSASIVHMVQIGAHIGFEENDPVAKGISSYLGLLGGSESTRVHWTFVEPSPPSFDRLM